MHTSAPDAVAGYPGGGYAPDKDANAETTLGGAYSPVDYKSITSFPRLPEADAAASGEHALTARQEDHGVLSEQDTGEAGSRGSRGSTPREVL